MPTTFCPPGPAHFYDAIGLDDLLPRCPHRVLDMGEIVGTLLPDVADELGLPAGIPVADGGADAFVTMIGLNVRAPGKLAFITGSSHLHLGQSATPCTARASSVPTPTPSCGANSTVEGGQVSTGSIVKSLSDNFCGTKTALATARGVDVYTVLNELALAIPPGSEGLIVVNYCQGNRTPYVNPEARGIILGLSLHHGAGHLFRAVIEGIAYGTEHHPANPPPPRLRVDEIVAAAGRPRARSGCRSTPTSAMSRSRSRPSRTARCLVRRSWPPWLLAFFPTYKAPPTIWCTSVPALARPCHARSLQVLCGSIHQHLPAAATVDPRDGPAQRGASVIFPATRLTLSGERFTVLYRLVAGGEAEARALARGICLEQTVEVSDELLADDDIRGHVVGRIEALDGAGSGRYDVAISYAVETAAGEFTQLLNVTFGNSAMQPGIRVLRLDLPPSLLQQFKGPRFGRAGLRALLGVAGRPLLGTALKPMGLSAVDLADLAYQLALGGVDIIKEDHGLTDQPFAPFAAPRAPLRRGGCTSQPRDRLSLSLCAQRDCAGRSHPDPCPAG